jgi:hypothetical protein
LQPVSIDDHINKYVVLMLFILIRMWSNLDEKNIIIQCQSYIYIHLPQIAYVYYRSIQM